MDILVINSFNKINARVRNEINSLYELENNISVVLWDRGGLEEQQLTDEEAKKYDINRIPLRAPRSDWRLVFFFPVFWLYCLWFLFSKEKTDYDIIHCCHPGVLPIGIILSFCVESSVIYDSFEYYVYSFYKNIPKRFQTSTIKKVFLGLENTLVRLVSGVLTVDSHKSKLENRYREYNSNTKCIYNVPSVEKDLNLQEVSTFNKSNEIITMIGGIDIHKGSLKAVRAIDYLVQNKRNIELILIGKVRDGSEKKLTKEIRDRSLSNNIEYVGWLPYLDMLNYLKGADAGLYLQQPSERTYMLGKGNSRKIFTYMYCRLPVIVPSFGEHGQVVRDVECGLSVDSTDPVDIANAIEYIVDHPQEANSMANRGRVAVEQKYNWENEFRKVEQVYAKAKLK
ncbi:glycosyltransferase involved in cell wall biosynthesis [Salinibacter ruber]|uniref:glycosyltransferase family 4 protein n=1 Tax=Salinibacter ruber TaxID=146919 RepID=UPI00216982A4|nr:glycosyltransferase family 4 protein [Salinibacter ruber]MCS3856497.1 glycosyltransferase involved in cell wall biosynthesis [Salinibacter ruber]